MQLHLSDSKADLARHGSKCFDSTWSGWFPPPRFSPLLSNRTGQGNQRWSIPNSIFCSAYLQPADSGSISNILSNTGFPFLLAHRNVQPADICPINTCLKRRSREQQRHLNPRWDILWAARGAAPGWHGKPGHTEYSNHAHYSVPHAKKIQ